MSEMRQLCYTMIGKVIPKRKASQQSVPDAGALRVEHFSGFELFLLSNRVRARPQRHTSRTQAVETVEKVGKYTAFG